MLASWSWLSFAALVLSICVWFVAPDMVGLLWVSAEVKWGSVVPTRGVKYKIQLIFAFVVCGLWFLACKFKKKQLTTVMIFIAYIYNYNPTYWVTLTANPTRETKHQIAVA